MAGKNKLVAKPLWIIYHWYHSIGFDGFDFDAEGVKDFLYCTADLTVAIRMLNDIRLERNDEKWFWDEDHTSICNASNPDEADEGYYVSQEYCFVEAESKTVDLSEVQLQ